MHTVTLVGQTSGVEASVEIEVVAPAPVPGAAAELPPTGSAAGELTLIGTGLLAAGRRPPRGEPSPARGGAGDLMTSRTRRAALALVGGVVALGSVIVPSAASPAPAPAALAGACTDATGITVVVDFSAFGDGVVVRCAPQPVRSGFDALTRAGFTFAGTTQFPGLLCRINGEPASDPCHGAPPPNAYWGYWHAPRGGSWTYSTSGAGSRVPPAGSVEGWSFGDRDEPGMAPPAAGDDPDDPSAHDPHHAGIGRGARDRDTDHGRRPGGRGRRYLDDRPRRLDEHHERTWLVGPRGRGRRRRW